MTRFTSQTNTATIDAGTVLDCRFPCGPTTLSVRMGMLSTSIAVSTIAAIIREADSDDTDTADASIRSARAPLSQHEADFHHAKASGNRAREILFRRGYLPRQERDYYRNE